MHIYLADAKKLFFSGAVHAALRPHPPGEWHAAPPESTSRAPTCGPARQLRERLL
jgi:hypothetical protein